MGAAAAYLDWVNLMAYDFNGPWNAYSGHVAPLYRDPDNPRTEADAGLNIADAVAQYQAAGVDRHKLVLGLPFYGYGWTGCRPALQGQYQECAGKLGKDGSVTFGEIEGQYLGRTDFVRHWNAHSLVPFLYRESDGTWIGYEDEQSLVPKLDLVVEQGLGGVMIWEIGQDPTKKLLSVIAQRLRPGERS
jgi:chitinase